MLSITLKLFRRAKNPFYRALLRVARLPYHHAALQIGDQDYYMHISGLTSCPAEQGDYQKTYEIAESRYNQWRSNLHFSRKTFHKLRYLLSPWFPYPNCVSFASSLVIWNKVFYNVNDLIKELEA